MLNEYIPSLQPDYEKPREGTYFDVLFGLIVLLAASFSAYTTYLGFSYDIPASLAVTLAVIIGLGLVATNLKIREGLRRATGIARPLVAFAVIFIFSFVSNTNAIYTYFLERDIVGKTQEEAWRIFDSESSRIIGEVQATPAVAKYRDREKALATAQENLRRQIQDPANPGMGQLAQRHLEEVTDLLGVSPTPYMPPDPSSPLPLHRAYAERLDALIAELAKTQLAADPGAVLLAFAEKVNRVREFYEAKVRAKEYDRNTTDLMHRDLDAFGVAASELLGRKLEITSIDPEKDEVGSFQYTWTNFSKFTSPAAIILSVLLGALLDVLAPVLSISLYRADGVY